MSEDKFEFSSHPNYSNGTSAITTCPIPIGMTEASCGTTKTRGMSALLPSGTSFTRPLDRLSDDRKRR